LHLNYRRGIYFVLALTSFYSLAFHWQTDVSYTSLLLTKVISIFPNLSRLDFVLAEWRVN